MRDMPDHGGTCPVADDAPELFPENETAVSVYFQARQSATQVSTDKRTLFYLRPEAVAAILEMRDVPVEERGRVFRDVQVLQDIENEIRPSKPRKRQVGGGSQRRRMMR